jgi:hypothetical protein
MMAHTQVGNLWTVQRLKCALINIISETIPRNTQTMPMLAVLNCSLKEVTPDTAVLAMYENAASNNSADYALNSDSLSGSML